MGRTASIGCDGAAATAHAASDTMAVPDNRVKEKSMNQDQVKSQLLRLNKDVEDFTVVFSGKKSRKVDGLYKPDTREILIHNKNFDGDNALMYTAIHEFAHHIQFTQAAAPSSTRVHTARFWDILHRLLYDAEHKGIYANLFESDPRFTALTKRIREKYLGPGGALMKEFGRLLMEAEELCRECQASFDDYVDRVLMVHRAAAKTIMKLHALDVNPTIGYENMKTVAKIRDPERRTEVQNMFLDGNSPDMVKARFMSNAEAADDPVQRLLHEKSKIMNAIKTLQERLLEIDERLHAMKGTGESA